MRVVIDFEEPTVLHVAHERAPVASAREGRADLERRDQVLVRLAADAGAVEANGETRFRSQAVGGVIDSSLGAHDSAGIEDRPDERGDAVTLRRRTERLDAAPVSAHACVQELAASGEGDGDGGHRASRVLRNEQL